MAAARQGHRACADAQRRDLGMQSLLQARLAARERGRQSRAYRLDPSGSGGKARRGGGGARGGGGGAASLDSDGGAAASALHSGHTPPTLTATSRVPRTRGDSIGVENA